MEISEDLPMPESKLTTIADNGLLFLSIIRKKKNCSYISPGSLRQIFHYFIYEIIGECPIIPNINTNWYSNRNYNPILIQANDTSSNEKVLCQRM